MSRALLNAVVAALVGALGGLAALTVVYSRHAAVQFEMDRDLPDSVVGMYPVERSGDLTFAWASRRVQLSLPGVSRRSPWTCSARFQGGRPQGVDQPTVDFAIDGVTRGSRGATNTYQDIDVEAPPKAGSGLIFTITSSSAFVPGPGDRRELALQLDSLACRPAGAFVWPPRRALTAAALAGAAFGAGFALAGVSWTAALAGVLSLAVLQAFPLSMGAAPSGPYTDRAATLAYGIALPMVLLARALEWRKGAPLRHAARFVITFTAGALYLKLIALFHPSKLPIDVVFQAHRLEWVLSGRYFFTQPMPSGVEFPYAIALYVFSAPWSAFTRDYVSLLRIVVCAAEAVAGGLLYVMISRIWNDRRAGAYAVLLFSVVPVSYGVIGNANLTNAFGQAAALVALAAATLWMFPGRYGLTTAALSALIALALLSHVSTIALLSTTLVAVVALYWLIGGRPLRSPAKWILAATLVAAVFSVAIYYGHFIDVYRNLSRTRDTAATAPSVAGAAAAPTSPAVTTPPPTPFSRRLGAALDQSVWSIGWPMAILAIVGLWRTWVAGARDRLGLLLAAWGIAFLVFIGVAIFPRVNVSFERYAAEFVGRVDLATYPAAVILAGRGAAWGWSAGKAARVISIVGLVAALVVGGRMWMEWFS